MTSDHEGTMLRGLPGDNPLGFFAALGALAAVSAQGGDYRMHWTDGPIPHPVLTPAVDPEIVARAALDLAAEWLDGPALSEELDPKLKLKAPAIREYLGHGREAGPSGVLGACLLAEGSLDNGGNAKPTDLYFTAGNQKFISVARANLDDTTADEIVDDIMRPWEYTGDCKSLMWDTVDDRDHALSAWDPTDSSNNKKLTNAGAEALAILGLSYFPCFASAEGTLTQGCSGSWKRGSFVWPLWTDPASRWSVRSLLAHVAEPEGENRRRRHWYQGWGVSRVLKSQIRRSDQGGYGTFGPPRVVWQRD